ncbi:hypothetical protein ACJ41O_010474 [Fusarium nematophilum]
MAPQSVIDLQYRGRVAILTIENEQKLNALGKQEYYDLAQRMREVAARDEVVVTVLLARGRYFSAGADVSFIQNAPTGPEAHQHWLSTFVASNLNITHAFATHPKVIVVGLNGPVVGLTAALVAHADFIYCTPSTFLLTPFSSIGLVAEGGASRALAQRLGPARANEALLMSRPIDAAALERCGFRQVDDPKSAAFYCCTPDSAMRSQNLGDATASDSSPSRSPRQARSGYQHKAAPGFVDANATFSLHQDTKGPEPSSSDEVMVAYTTYPFLIASNLAGLCPQDIAFLEAKGAFHVPMKPILDELIRQYFLHVHPFLPLLHEGQFWSAYRQDERAGPAKVSLLLFQAVIFASCSFLPEVVVKALGYDSIRSARSVFYRNAKVRPGVDCRAGQCTY